MQITIKDPKENRYYFANVSQRWAIQHDNGALVSLGLTVDKDLSRRSFDSLQKRGALKEISHEQWNRSGSYGSENPSTDAEHLRNTCLVVGGLAIVSGVLYLIFRTPSPTVVATSPGIIGPTQNVPLPSNQPTGPQGS